MARKTKQYPQEGLEKLTAQQIADKLGCSLSNVSRLQSLGKLPKGIKEKPGVKPQLLGPVPSGYLVAQIAKYLGVSYITAKKAVADGRVQFVDTDVIGEINAIVPNMPQDQPSPSGSITE